MVQHLLYYCCCTRVIYVPDIELFLKRGVDNPDVPQVKTRRNLVSVA